MCLLLPPIDPLTWTLKEILVRSAHCLIIRFILLLTHRLLIVPVCPLDFVVSNSNVSLVFLYSRNQLLSFHSMGKLSCTPMLLMKLKSMDILRYHGNRSGWLSKARSMRNGLRIPTTSLNWSHYRFLLNIWSVTSLLQSHEPLCYHCGGYCANNWITIRLEPPSFNSPSFVPLVFSPLNSWSISDKSSLIKNFIANHDIDLCALTKKWLRGNDSDLYNIRDICPDGYVFYHAPRLHSSGEELVLS